MEEWGNDSVNNDISDDSEPEDGEIAFVNISPTATALVQWLTLFLLTLQGAFHLSNIYCSVCFLDFCQLS